ncbi:hypothetical protein SLA2020_286300 [Shorea laevis]
MSVERSFEAWEEVQRHGQDLADRLAQGFTGLIQSHMSPPSFPWPNPQNSKLFDLEFPSRGGLRGGLEWVSSAVFQEVAGAVLAEENAVAAMRVDVEGSRLRSDVGVTTQGDFGTLSARLRELGFAENDSSADGSLDDEVAGFNLRTTGLLGRPQGIINITSTYDSRTHDAESSLVARGDLWRVEASQGSSTSGNENSSLLLVQLGPVLFVRDTTLLLPVHLSKQHLLWYGYDRKNGMHSLCPAVWSKHRRWLLMSMLCLNPLACSFVDLQFPNGQLTYVSGEGLTTSAFLPICGGLLQAQGQYPGEMRFSFSCKNKWGTRITPMVQWPDKSFTFGLAQALAWQRSGLMVRPTIQFRLDYMQYLF